ncbi:MAG: (4Fe-4S)-binding protein [Desulfacinum sp.]|jgi:NADH dehydrogenase/NADH:ubiquinone oxidoreductase subunit G|nr:(4Fe-4S)-binding protein [Desulfacinum sp.]
MITLDVDGRTIQVEAGITVLEACLQNGIFIPNLCFLKTRKRPHASCRLCFVEIDGLDRPVPSCTLKVRDGMKVRTDTEPVRRLQGSAFKLLMSTHVCTPRECPTQGRCQLIRTAKLLKVSLKPTPLERLERDVDPVVRLGPLVHYPYRCVLCGRCIHVCGEESGHGLLTFAKRGFNTVVATFVSQGEEGPCAECAACVGVCPTGALTLEAPETPEIEKPGLAADSGG